MNLTTIFPALGGIAFGTMAFFALSISAAETPCNADCQTLKKEHASLKKTYDQSMKEGTKNLKLKPYKGIKIVKNAEKLKNCPKSAIADGTPDPQKYDLANYFQCYYVQIDNIDYADLEKAMKLAEFARTKCLEDSKALAADTSSVDFAKGKFTFNRSGQPCYEIQAKKVKELKAAHYKCNSKQELQTGSGKPYFDCSNGKSSIMVFKTKLTCGEETLDQNANQE